ncbi:MAG TPA: SemiSWEET transporter [Spirochaetota bacterium]|nr:SemiSWEET transporter [Spirochaetota bacterium]
MIEIFGFIAGILTTSAFLPQLVKIIKSRHTKDLSIIMYLLFCSGIVLWIVYGVALRSLPIIIFNVITLVLNLIILFIIVFNKINKTGGESN